MFGSFVPWRTNVLPSNPAPNGIIQADSDFWLERWRSKATHYNDGAFAPCVMCAIFALALSQSATCDFLSRVLVRWNREHLSDVIVAEISVCNWPAPSPTRGPVEHPLCRSCRGSRHNGRLLTGDPARRLQRPELSFTPPFQRGIHLRGRVHANRWLL